MTAQSPPYATALVLTDVLGWSAAEVAECLEKSPAAVNSALRRARAALARRDVAPSSGSLTDSECDLLDRYVEAFHRYDVDALVALLREDATLSMPPYTLWRQGPDAIRSWLLGRGAGCRGSRLLPTACGLPAFGQYRPPPEGGHQPWSLTVSSSRTGASQPGTHSSTPRSSSRSSAFPLRLRHR